MMYVWHVTHSASSCLAHMCVICFQDDSSHDPHAPSKPTTSPSAEESETRTEEEELERQLDAEIEEQPQTKIQVDVDGRAVSSGMWV